MKNKALETEEKKAKGSAGEGIIGIGQPFEYEDVVSVTGPDYVENLQRGGMSFRPYEELKRNTPGFHLREQECIWMRAGIINFRLCDRDFDCYNCPFDENMKRAMGGKALHGKEEKASPWMTQVSERYRVAQGPCIHYLSGRMASPGPCENNYECYRCPVQEALEARRPVRGMNRPKYTNVSGYRVADGYYYHMGHSWAQLTYEGNVRIGMDDFTSRVFGPADRIEIPPVGTTLRQGEVGWLLSRQGQEAPMQMPVSGTVIAVNDEVKKDPRIAHAEPYQEGWLFVLDPARLKPDLKGLYFGRESFRWMERESRDLLDLLGHDYDKLAATGGETVRDIVGSFPEADWERLVRSFLRTCERET
ncbi:MAG: glycine cleavage system protein H [Deltaproteobacteria bacterium]|nr:glycine cleavage system protein H [Deltaproteobacteria bacterium]